MSMPRRNIFRWIPGLGGIPDGMAILRWSVVVLITIANVLGISRAMATTLMKLDLGSLCKRAEKIVRGEVIEIIPGFVNVGGGQLPTVTYKLQVTSTLQGSADDVFSLTILGNLKEEPAKEPIHRAGFLKDFPRLEKGQTYLLFATKPSKAGLSTTVGLGQGCFHINTKDGGKSEFAVNGFNNSGLGLPKDGPVEYQALVDEIRKRLRNEP